MNKETMRKHYEKTPKDILINILISSREQVEKLQNRNKELKQEIERLNNKIKRIAYQWSKSDMSYEEFKQIWVNAMGKIYEPSQIDELEKELGVDKE